MKSAKYLERDYYRAFCLSGTLAFTRYFFKTRFGKKFIAGSHHTTICNALDRVARGECRRLIINCPPRYSKTELAVKNFIAYGFALNPAARFIHLSYSDDLARDNSAGVRSIMQEPRYQELFDIALDGTAASSKWSTPQGGGLYAVSSGGQVTGFGAGLVRSPEEEEELAALEGACRLSSFGGAIIIDDPIKPDDAFSDNIREKVNVKFETTIRNRVNSRLTPIVVIMQRLHEHDLCGYLIATEPDAWEVVRLPAISPGPDGEPVALWPAKHSLDELRAIEAADPIVFGTQYLQDPRPLEGLMYSSFKTYSLIPRTKAPIRKCYVDTADTGADYLCAILYTETEGVCYIQDVLYTKKPMDHTEPELAKRICCHKTRMVIVESNNGGRGFARNVERLVRQARNPDTSFHTFAQTANKRSRIFAASARVQNVLLFPEGWQHLWPDYYRAMASYRKEGLMAHDDAPDATTGVVEWMGKLNGGMREEDILNAIL